MARRGITGVAGAGKEQSQSASGVGQSGGTTNQNRENLGRGDGNGGNGGSQVSNSAGQMTFSSEEIAERAYQIYERDGRNDGRDMDHWLQAERELREERERKGTGAQGAVGVSLSAGSAQESRVGNENSDGRSNARPQRPDEAPRSARRHQTMAQ